MAWPAAFLFVLAACTKSSMEASSCVGLASVPIYGGVHDAGAVPAAAEALEGAIGELLTIESDALCTATRFAPGWAITAAHCVRDGAAHRFRTPHGDSDVAYTVPHPTLDVALIALDDTREHGSVPAAMLELEKSSAPAEGQTVLLAGRGVTEAGEQGELHFVTQVIASAGPDALVVDGQGSRGACLGDSGGPLLVRSAGHQERYSVAGVLSRGSASCTGLDEYLPAATLHAWIAQVRSKYCEEQR